MTDSVVVIFARRPQRERKRFGLGRIADQRVAAHLVHRTLRCAAACAEFADVVFADDEMQQGETFEDRLLHVLEQVRAAGYRRVALIGADTPSLRPADLRTALTADTPVIGPSSDGGFYLLGLDLSDVDVLRGLPWGTAAVQVELLGRLPSVIQLVTRQDIDDPRDVIRLLSLLREQYLDDVGAALDNSAPLLTVVPELAGPTRLEPRPCEQLRGPPLAA